MQGRIPYPPVVLKGKGTHGFLTLAGAYGMRPYGTLLHTDKPKSERTSIIVQAARGTRAVI